MNKASITLISLLLGEGILDYAGLTNVTKDAIGVNISREEKNIAPSSYRKHKLNLKGFLPEVRIQDFPIRGQKVALCT